MRWLSGADFSIASLTEQSREQHAAQQNMRTELITKRDDLAIRRLILEPGEAMPWHTDSCHRFSVVVRGDQLRIEFRSSGDQVLVAVHPGMADWDEPDERVHRGVNVGTTPYEEIVTFFLENSDVDPQPEYS